MSRDLKALSRRRPLRLEEPDVNVPMEKDLFEKPPPAPERKPHMVAAPAPVAQQSKPLMDVNESVIQLMNDCGQDPELQAFYYACKALDVDFDQPERDFATDFVCLLHKHLKVGEDITFPLRVMDRLRPTIKKPFSLDQAKKVVSRYPVEIHAACAAKHFNYGVPIDHMSALKALFDDPTVGVRSSGRTVTLSCGRKLPECEVLLVHSKFRATMYNRDVELVEDGTKKFTAATTPTGAAQYSNILGLHRKLDTRRVESMSGDWRHYLHFIVSHLEITKRNVARRTTKFGEFISLGVFEKYLVLNPDHAAVLTWCQRYLNDAIAKDEKLKQINHLVLLDLIKPKDFFDFIQKKFGVKGVDAEIKLGLHLSCPPLPAPMKELVEIVVDRAELGDCNYMPEANDYQDLPKKIVELATSIFHHGKVPTPNGPNDYCRILGRIEQMSQGIRGTDKYSIDRAYAEGFGPFFMDSSRVMKAELATALLIDIIQAWKGKCVVPGVPITFAHVGTTANNFTDWSKQLHKAGVPIRYFDIMANPQHQIEYWNIVGKEFPRVLKGLYKVVLDDTFVNTIGNVNLNATHSNHNKQNHAVLDALVEMLKFEAAAITTMDESISDHGVLGYAKKLFYAFDETGHDIDLLINKIYDVGRAGNFTHVRLITGLNRLGNSEFFAVWARLPTDFEDAEAWGFPIYPDGSKQDRVEKHYMRNGMCQAYAYQIGGSLLRTAGFGIWALPCREWQRLDQVERVTKHLKDLEYQMPELNDSTDPLADFVKHAENRFSDMKGKVFLVKELLFALYDTDPVPDVIRAGLARLLGCEPEYLDDQETSINDLLDVWFSASRYAPMELFRIPKVVEEPEESRPSERFNLVLNYTDKLKSKPLAAKRSKPKPKSQARRVKPKGKEPERDDEDLSDMGVEDLTTGMRTLGMAKSPVQSEVSPDEDYHMSGDGEEAVSMHLAGEFEDPDHPEDYLGSQFASDDAAAAGSDAGDGYYDIPTN